MMQLHPYNGGAPVRQMVGIILSLLLIVPALNAQGKPSVSGDSSGKFFYPGSGRASQNGTPQSINLDIKDSSLSYVLRRISAVSGKQIIFSTTFPQLSKRTSVRIKDVSAIEAVNIALKGSGLTAAVSSDGNTIAIRGPGSGRDTVSSRDSGTLFVGRILDSATGKPIQGATVTLVSNNKSAITQPDGWFKIYNVPVREDQVLVKILGYKSRQVPVKVVDGNMQAIVVRIVTSTTSLNEVVTTATGSQRRVEIPSDIVKIDAEKIRQRAPVRSVADMIEASQVPGVVMTRASGDPGAATRIRIRGIGSISQTNDPVYIVDGIWVDATVQSPSRIDQIDPETIETIEIVRGPSAATLYGQDASNGVIVITTKRGTPGTTRWNVGYSRDWGKAYGKIPPFYEGHGYNQITGVRVLCPIEDVLNFRCVQDSVAIYNPNNRMVLREGQEREDVYSLSLDGGSNTVRYSLAASTSDVLGVRRAAPIDLIRMRILGLRYGGDILKPSRLKDHSLSSNLSLQPREDLDVFLTVKAGFGNLTDNNYNFALSPTDNPLSLDTVAFVTDGLERKFNQNRKVTRTNNTSFGSSASWRARYGFLVKGTAGLDQTSRNETGSTVTHRCMLMECNDDLGIRNESNGTTTVASLRTNVSTVLVRGGLSKFLELTPVIGFDLRSTKRESFSILKDSVPGGESSIESGRVRNALGQRIEVADGGWYLSSTIGILKRLYFDVGIRQDIGSAITSSSNATYPKLGGSWLISDEGFWPQNNLVNLLRLRATIGHAAVQPDITDIKGSYVTGTKFVDGKLVKSLELVKVGNSELVPERAVELEVGFDMDLWNERIRIVNTYAHKENKNTLVSTQLPYSFGQAILMRKENIGRVQNRNLELTINTIALDKDWLRIEVDYSHSISDNRVKSLGNGTSRLVRGASLADGTEVIAVGYPLGSVWKEPVIGFFDENRDGILGVDEIIRNDSLSYVGTSIPRYIGSYGINAAIFGNIRIDSRFSYQSSSVASYQPSDVRGGRVDYGSQDVTAPLVIQAQSRAMGISPVSNIRWNSASISYSLSPRRISFLNTRSMSISIQGSNLGLWTKFLGRDPWVNTAILSGSEVITVDQGFIPPPPRTFALNIKMGL